MIMKNSWGIKSIDLEFAKLAFLYLNLKRTHRQSMSFHSTRKMKVLCTIFYLHSKRSRLLDCEKLLVVRLIGFWRRYDIFKEKMLKWFLLVRTIGCLKWLRSDIHKEHTAEENGFSPFFLCVKRKASSRGCMLMIWKKKKWVWKNPPVDGKAANWQSTVPGPNNPFLGQRKYLW